MEKQNARSEIKSKRIVAPDKDNMYGALAATEAYLKLLRTRDKTKKIYDVDPYAEVYQFRSNVYSIFTHNLDNPGGDPWIHLIVGPEKCMLIDNSYGLGDLKGLVNEITGNKPIIACNTHMHFDHSYGNCQFDKVYCHENEVQRLERTKNPHIWDYLFDENGKGIFVDFDRNDLIAYKDYEIVGCPDGTIFDLGGGHEVELIFLGGHTVGHAAYLDKKDRLLFMGDDGIFDSMGVRGVEPGEDHGECATLHCFKRNLEKLLERMPEYDSVFPGHGILDICPQYLTELLRVLEQILENPDSYDERISEIRHGESIIRYKKRIPAGILSYNPEAI